MSPLLTFNPAFTLLVAWLALAEVPGVHQIIGLAVVLPGIAPLFGFTAISLGLIGYVSSVRSGFGIERK